MKASTPGSGSWAGIVQDRHVEAADGPQAVRRQLRDAGRGAVLEEAGRPELGRHEPQLLHLAEHAVRRQLEAPARHLAEAPGDGSPGDAVNGERKGHETGSHRRIEQLSEPCPNIRSSDILAPMSAADRSSDEVLTALAVDRSSPIPLWFQVAQHFEQSIAAGTLPQGALLDNEIVLAQRLGISRPTMRRAMEQLVDQGLVVRRRGIGTRVVQPKVRRPLELTSLHDDLAGSGQAPSTTVLRFETVGADADVAGRLRLDEGDPVVLVERLRSAREQPIARMTNWLPADIVTFEADALAATGLYDLLRRTGVHLHSATQTVGARTATATEARELAEPRGAALLTMERETLDDHGTVVELARHLYAASRYSFEINLVRG